MADNYAYIFKAENCRKVAGQDLDETEFISIEELPAQKIDEMIETGEFPQAVHIVAWLRSRG